MTTLSKMEDFFRDYLADFGVIIREYTTELTPNSDNTYPDELVFRWADQHVLIRITGIRTDSKGEPIQWDFPRLETSP